MIGQDLENNIKSLTSNTYKCEYIDIMAHKEKSQRIMLIQSISFTSKINLEEYTG